MCALLQEFSPTALGTSVILPLAPHFRKTIKELNMETLLIITAIGWVLTGVNLLFTWENKPELGARRIQEA